jgi:electron transport complex protein RnfE
MSATAANGLGMGISATVVLIASNAAISAVKSLIPDKVRIPAYIVLIATFVTILEYVLHAYLPDLFDSMGLFIPLIVVNCIILGRAEAFAAKNGVLVSIADGISIGGGFTIALTLLGCIREFLSAGTIFGITWQLSNGTVILPLPEAYNIQAFGLPPGAFITLGFMIAGAGLIKNALAKPKR